MRTLHTKHTKIEEEELNDMKKVATWKLQAWDEEGREYKMKYIPNDIAQAIDDWFSEMEGKGTLPNTKPHEES